MFINFINEQDNVIRLEVDASLSIEDLKALVGLELNVPRAGINLLFQQRELPSSRTVGECGLSEEDLIMVTTTSQAAAPAAQHAIPQYRTDPSAMQAIQFSPSLLQPSNLYNPDPSEVEMQRRIEEEIRRRNIDENMAQAFEHAPEVFSQVHMLYINCFVNNVAVKAFVDSGAQSTIMSVQCAQRCNIMHLVDSRFAGMAKGVGSARILGRVHMAHIKMGSEVFVSSFTILEGQGVDFLLGLDMLRKHQACIDLGANVLRIGGQAIPFLSESEIPHEGGVGEGLSISQPPPSAAAGGAGRTLGGSAPPPAAAVQSAPLGHGQSLTSRSRLLQQISSLVPGGSTPGAMGVPSAPSQPTQQQQGSAGAAVPAPVSEEVVAQLMAFGFTRHAVIQALQLANGNPDTAFAILTGS